MTHAVTDEERQQAPRRVNRRRRGRINSDGLWRRALACLWIGALGAALLTLQGCASSRPAVRGDNLRGMVLSDADGRAFMLGDGRGQVRLIHFFATWCFTCLIETPGLDQLSRELAPCGLSVIGIGMDLEGAAVLAPFAQMHGLDPTSAKASEAALRSSSLTALMITTAPSPASRTLLQPTLRWLK